MRSTHKHMTLSQIERCDCRECLRWNMAVAEGEARAETEYQRQLRQIETALAALTGGEAG